MAAKLCVTANSFLVQVVYHIGPHFQCVDKVFKRYFESLSIASTLEEGCSIYIMILS